MIKGQVQTNNNINILVDTIKSSNSHHYHGNIKVEVTKILTDEEVRYKAEEIMTLNDCKRILMCKDNYASSNCESKEEGIEYNSIVEYKKL